MKNKKSMLLFVILVFIANSFVYSQFNYEGVGRVNQLKNAESGIIQAFTDDSNTQVSLSVKKDQNLRSGTSRIVLKANNVWGDGSGYVVLLNDTHDLYGQYVNFASKALAADCNIPQNIKDKITHMVPTNGEISCNPSAGAFLAIGETSADIPAGIYDYCIINAETNKKVWIASGENSKGDDYEFKDGYVYTFEMVIKGTNDFSNLTITGGDGSSPSVTNLQVNQDGANVNVSWTAPATRTETVILEQGFEGALPGWSVYDKDGDGLKWAVDKKAGTFAHSGSAVAFSLSMNSGAPVDPDNWLVTPMFGLTSEGTLTYHIRSYTNSPTTLEHYGVYTSSTGMEIADFGTAPIFEEVSTGGWLKKTVTLPANTKYVAFRHYESKAKSCLMLDDLKITTAGGSGNDDQPTNFTYSLYRDNVVIAANITETNYTDNNVAIGEHSYCVKVNYSNNQSSDDVCKTINVIASNYPPVTDLNTSVNNKDITLTWTAPASITAENVIINEGFETGGNGPSDLPANWSVLDADGDGYNWGRAFLEGYANTGSGLMISASFFPSQNDPNGGTVVDPNNYLVSPELELPNGGTLAYSVANLYPAVAKQDKYSVYVSTTGKTEADFTQAILTDEVPGNNWTGKTLVLPAGTKYVAFRHDDKGKGILRLDDVKVTANVVSTKTYTVYRNDVSIAQGITETTYKDLNLESGVYNYCVEVNYGPNKNSDKVCKEATIIGTNIEDILENRILINGGNACINFDIESRTELMIYDAAGRLITKTVKEGVSSDLFNPGLYIVHYNVENVRKVVKVVVR